MPNSVKTGAYQQTIGNLDFSGWFSMDTAPRDGTWVELKCTYGVAPWYCVAQWNIEELRWKKPDGSGPFSESSLHWRPYDGDIAAYTDPTGGMQNDAAYWRGAVASKYALPADHFEKVASPVAKAAPPRPWWKIIFG